jgi:hypothetical protein
MLKPLLQQDRVLGPFVQDGVADDDDVLDAEDDLDADDTLDAEDTLDADDTLDVEDALDAEETLDVDETFGTDDEDLKGGNPNGDVIESEGNGFPNDGKGMDDGWNGTGKPDELEVCVEEVE